MTYKQIEASKELRLWIGQVIVPAATAVTIMLANPNVRNFASEKVNHIKTKLQKKVKGLSRFNRRLFPFKKSV